ILARVGPVAHERVDLAHIGVEDHRPVELDLDPRALDRHLLEVPLAHGPEIAAPGRDHAVDGAMGLARVELAVLEGAVVEYLELAHAGIRGIARARIAD